MVVVVVGEEEKSEVSRSERSNEFKKRVFRRQVFANGKRGPSFSSLEGPPPPRSWKFGARALPLLSLYFLSFLSIDVNNMMKDVF